MSTSNVYFNGTNSLKPVVDLLRKIDKVLSTESAKQYSLAYLIGGLPGILVWSYIWAYIRSKREQEAKLLCYKEALKKQTAILEALARERNADKARIAELTELNRQLQQVIRKLEHDLQQQRQ